MTPAAGMFSQAELAKVVAKTVPPNRTHAVVGTVDEDGMAVVVKMTLRERWEVSAAYRRDWAGDQQTGVKVIYSW
jgi:hypothetical protein